jgi:hypothetical protein
LLKPNLLRLPKLPRPLLLLLLAHQPLLKRKSPKKLTSKAHPLAIKKPKLLRSNPHRFSAIKLAGLDPADVTEDEDLYTFWRRQWVPKFEPDFDSDDEELSDYVKTRLLIARTLAMKKYQEKWG